MFEHIMVTGGRSLCHPMRLMILRARHVLVAIRNAVPADSACDIRKGEWVRDEARSSRIRNRRGNVINTWPCNEGW